MAKQSKRKLTFGDTETTGLFGDPASLEECIALDRQIIDYAFADWDDGQILRKYSQKVMPTGDQVEEAIALAKQGFNRFDPDQWWRNKVAAKGTQGVYEPAAPWSGEDCEIVYDYLDGTTFAGSNPDFDFIIFKKEFHALGFLDDFPKLATRRKVDVGKLAWPLWAYQLTEKTGLESLTKLLGIPHEAHTALGDVEASIAVFEECCELYVGRPRRLLELARAAAECMTGEDRAELLGELEALGPGL